MDNATIVLETYQMHNLEFIHSMFAISDPGKIDAFPAAATFLFTMNHAITRVKCENLPETLVQSAPYKILHIDSPYPYRRTLEKILDACPENLVDQMSIIAQHYNSKYPDNSWVKELVKILSKARTAREVITSLACVLLILIKSIPKGTESTEKAFDKFTLDMETYFGLKVEYTFDLDINDISIVRKTCDIGDKLSNLIACVLHAKKLGHRSVVGAQATIGHYIEMTWSWYGNRIMKCLSAMCTTFNMPADKLLSYVSCYSGKLVAECSEISKLLKIMRQIPEAHHKYHCLFTPFREHRLGLKKCSAFGLASIAATPLDITEQFKNMQERDTGLTQSQLQSSLFCAEGLRRAQVEKEVKESMTPEEMEVHREVDKTRQEIKISVKSQNAKLEELSKMYRDGSVDIRAVILSQHKDLKDEIERRAAISEANVKVNDEVTALGLSMIKPRYKNRDASLRNNINENININIQDLKESLPAIPKAPPNRNKESHPHPEQNRGTENPSHKTKSDDIFADMGL